MWDRDIRIGLSTTPPNGSRLLPTYRFRDRAIRLIRGFTEEPDGRWAWNVV
ncbi:hypothetical protein RE9427_16980 [Prescottella equi]|nr:hypothetical protein RE9427_16980 [Prescottella equi]